MGHPLSRYWAEKVRKKHIVIKADAKPVEADSNNALLETVS